jgi:hypothetical protein
MVVMAGCNDDNNAAGGRATSGGNATTTAQPTTTAAAMSADTKAACATIGDDIKTTMAKAAEAEEIGPPAGHLAVSAQYSAGAAGLYAHMFTASTEVNDAAKQVATAMSELADTYGTAPKAKPSKAALDSAVKQVTAACAAA